MNWIWPNFSEREMSCRCCGKADMDPAFMDKLQGLRDLVGKPLPVNSAYRCPKYNKKINGGPAHPKGVAVDLGIRGHLAHEVLTMALAMGFQGIGVKQKGRARFIHLDMLKGTKRAPRPWVWSYLIPLLFILPGCDTPSSALAKYQNEIRPVVKKEADAFVEFSFKVMCEYRTDRVNRMMEENGDRWAMGYALMCDQKWQAMKRAMESASSVPPPTYKVQ